MHGKTEPPVQDDPPPSELIPDRDMLVQFVEVMFRNARRDGFVSFRVFEDNGRSERPVRIQAVRLDDYEFVPLMLIAGAAGGELVRAGGVLPAGLRPSRTIATPRPTISAKASRSRRSATRPRLPPAPRSRPCSDRPPSWSRAAANGSTTRPARSSRRFTCTGG